MIVRPQLKTHWLQSQNPLSVSLGTLEKVIFSAPQSLFDFELLNTNQIQHQNLLPVSEVQTLKASSTEVNELASRRHTLSRDLFLGVFAGYEFSDALHWPENFNQLARTIEFHHSTGEVVSLVGAFRQKKWPAFLNPEFYLTDRSCLWEKALSDQGPHYSQYLKSKIRSPLKTEMEKMLMVIFEILAWSIQRERQIGDVEVLFSPLSSLEPAYQDRKAWPLKEIYLKSEREWKVTYAVVPEARRHQGDVLCQLSEKTLHEPVKSESAGIILRKFSPMLLDMFENEVEPSAQIQREGLLKNVNDIEIFNQTLNKHLPKIEIDQTCFIPVQSQDIQTSLSVRDQGAQIQLGLGLHINKLDRRLFGFNANLKDLLQPALGGIETFMGLDRKEAASVNPLYRANDLLLLRHSGVALFCYLELINQKLGQPNTLGDLIHEDDANEMLDYLKKAVMGLLGKYGENFDQSISRESKETFNQFIHKIRTLIQTRSFYEIHRLHSESGGPAEEKIVQISGVNRFALEIMRLLILHQAEVTQGKVFSKTKFAMGENFVNEMTPLFFGSSDNRPHFELLGPLSRMMPLLFELSDRGVLVDVNGQSIQDGSDSFRFAFDVKDVSSGDDTGEIKNDKLGLFELDPVVFFEGVRVSPNQLKLNINNSQYGYIEYKGQIYRIKKDRIPPLRSLQLFWNRIQGIKKENLRNKFGDHVYHVPRAFALELLMLKQKGIEVKATGSWQRIIDYFENGLGKNTLNLKNQIQEKLLVHQSLGAQWLIDLYELRLGAILADEMGLGKTFQILAFFEAMAQKGNIGLNLVVVPTSVLYNWVDEKKKFTPDLPFVIFDPTMKQTEVHTFQNEPKILLTTYGHLVESGEFFSQFTWNTVVFDEAQNLKNILSQRSVAARKIKSLFKVCLTGTPLENNYLEFYSLCDLVVPGCLGEVDRFKTQFLSLTLNPQLITDLKLTVKPLLLRRTKKQIKLDLPEKIIQDVVLPFKNEQKEIYKSVALSYSQQVDQLIQQQGEKKSQIAMFAALMRLRQICSDPSAVPGVKMNDTPVKIEHFLESVQEHFDNGESVLVFTQFLSTLHRISRELTDRGHAHSLLHGQVLAKDRAQLIKTFSDSSEPQVLLMTLKTGGVGLNLTKASVVYHLEPWWNPAVENQATDRAYRMGQTKNVKVFNLLIEGSLEERMVELKKRKSQMFNRLFDDTETVEPSGTDKMGLSKEDFKFLISPIENKS